MNNPDNENEVLRLHYMCKTYGKTPSDYMFGKHLDLEKQLAVDVSVYNIAMEHEAELAEEMKRKTKSHGS